MLLARAAAAHKAMFCRPRQYPLIVVVGATGTGKSQLAVELAKRFDGEIINGDAMQLYRGLPIITNKISAEEQQSIPHHLLGQIGLDEEPWVVSKFAQNVCATIAEIRSRNRLPILVGGTHYYTQSLLFKDSTVVARPNVSEDSASHSDIREEHPILNAETATILEKLRQVDPVMADRWHPNDRRKIQRSLEIWYQTGIPASRIYQEQAQQRSGGQNSKVQGEDAPGPTSLRFPTLLLWVHAESEVLRDRLDRRVEKMMQDGLLVEVNSLESYRRSQEAAGVTVDRTRGIWQCIGYKQFVPFLEAQDGHRSLEIVEKLKAEAVEQTQAANRQYAKRQIRWIRIKLLHALRFVGAEKYLYLLDGTNPDAWQTAVYDQAVKLTGRFLDGSPEMPSPSELSVAAREMLQPKREYDMSNRPDLWQRRTCEVCNVTSVTESDWTQHVKSKGHRRAVKNRLQLDAG
ncbi:tRNA isopentenyltransferase [Viridothelium virens]|uniref:tRNA dimethylallyltransferase n=1 Tax=Viridothelium virens TaxID=1048519 RepID=A0A6A6H641_VIRVR|nr:tRNA isopentenyltransferase [Viridothelium virens]